jgi:hypothetical protein
MAIAIVQNRVNGKGIVRATLLGAVGAESNGEWINLEGMTPFSIDVSGITNATVQIRVSNAASKPADASHGVQIGSDITVDKINEYTIPARWIKARVSAWVSGTITAILQHTST